MEAVFLKLLNMSIIAGWIVLALVILRPFLKKAPKWITCLMWALVALRLIFPFSIESVISLIPSSETIPSDIVYQAEPEIHTGISFINSSINPVISGSFAPKPFTSVNPLQIVSFIATRIWVIGMVVMVLYTLVSYIRLRLKVRESIPLEGNIRLCDHIPTPFILGLIRPKIYLPSNMSETDREYVIAHEKAHLKRRDHWWKPLGFGLLAVYWFNPLMWVAYVLLCRDIEIACDEKVIGKMPSEGKISYSKALINCSVSRKSVSACPLAFGEVGVKTRVKSVLNYKRPAFWVLILVIITCITVAVCFLTDPLSPAKGDVSVELVSLDISYEAPEITVKLIREEKEKEVFLCCVYREVNGKWISCKNPETEDIIIPWIGAEKQITFSLQTFDLSAEGKYKFEISSKEREGVTAFTEFYLENGNPDIGLIGGADGPTSVTISNSSIYKYINEEVKWDGATIIFNHQDKNYQFTCSYLSSTIYMGYYEIKDNRLYLNGNDDSDFVFDIVDGNFVFNASMSAPVPRYNKGNGETWISVPDGAVFNYVPSVSESFSANTVLDSISFDIDGDGQQEICEARTGGTSGRFTVNFVLIENDNSQKVHTVDMTPGDIEFVETKDGKLQVINEGKVYNVSYADGYMVVK